MACSFGLNSIHTNNMIKSFTHLYKTPIFLLALLFSISACQNPAEFEDIKSDIENTQSQDYFSPEMELEDTSLEESNTDQPILIQPDKNSLMNGSQKLRTPMLPSHLPNRRNCWGKC